MVTGRLLFVIAGKGQKVLKRCGSFSRILIPPNLLNWKFEGYSNGIHCMTCINDLSLPKKTTKRTSSPKGNDRSPESNVPMSNLI